MSAFWSRLKDDFSLSIITLVGSLAVLGVTPYAVYRLGQQNWLVGFTDSFLVVSTVLAVSYAWRTGNTVRPGQFLAAIYSIGAFLVSIKLGTNGLFWMYVLILFNFFVVPPRQSVIVTQVTLLAVCLYGWLNRQEVFASHYQMGSFIVTYELASIFAFVFAYRGRAQRRELSQLATEDPLTGAGNRRTMNKELDIAVADSRRYHIRFGLLVLDLDHFKQINDQFGHAVGDDVLVEFVKLVDAACRPSDRLFRLGGEEFVLLVPNVTREGLNGVASKILQCVREVLRRPDGLPVTVSIGGCMLNGHAERESWLHEADASLYAAKDAGRDRIVIAAM